MTVHVLGIRHHGPGSARSVAAALTELSPDLVLIEGVPELEALVPHAASPDLVPPVAGLVYDPAEPRRSMFYPLASFSPEWVALQWAVGHHVEVRFADLPAIHQLAEVEEPSRLESPSDLEPEGAVGHRLDIIGQLAAAAGYDDAERWWEDAIEHRHDSALADFATLLQAVSFVRDDAEFPLDVETARREAAMRRALRTAIKQGRERIAFICGAFHAPALVPTAFPSQTSDNVLLAKLPKTKVMVTWAPWTSGRLAYESGYGAGVTAPGWYAHLFGQWQSGHTDAGSTWLVRVAHELRGHDLDAAPATVVEAARLAEALATLRGRPSVGLAELDDATLTTLAEGSMVPLDLVRRELVVGHDLGRVPDDVPMVPLAADLTRQLRTLRLKQQALATELTLDLRKEAGLARSVLFHRLDLLGIDWAQAAEARTTGTFKEVWVLEWQPEYAVRLIEAGVHGTTVASAAASRVRELASGDASISSLAALLERCLLAELPEALADLVLRLDASAAQHTDVATLLAAIEPLARTLRYGDVREVDLAGLGSVVEAMVLRACVGLRAACASLDDDAAEAMRTAVEGANAGIALLDDETLRTPWRQALGRVADDEAVHGAVSGRANRMLLDAGVLAADETAARMSRRLSVAQPASAAAAWIDGFLTGDALLLLHDHDLLAVIDDWVATVPESAFDDLLPLLRRSFSRYHAPELRQIGQAVRNLGTSGPALAALDGEVDAERARPAVVRVATLLGLDLLEVS